MSISSLFLIHTESCVPKQAMKTKAVNSTVQTAECRPAAVDGLRWLILIGYLTLSPDYGTRKICGIESGPGSQCNLNYIVRASVDTMKCQRTSSRWPAHMQQRAAAAYALARRRLCMRHNDSTFLPLSEIMMSYQKSHSLNQCLFT